MTQEEIERRARRENAADLWSRLWANPETRDWREVALARVYARIAGYVPNDAKVVDVGGGVGAFARALRDERPDAMVLVCDHSDAARRQAEDAGFRTCYVDLEDVSCRARMWDVATARDRAEPVHPLVVSTEVLEHLSAEARRDLLAEVAGFAPAAFCTVPNNRLGPDVEPQHTIQFTAVSFAAELREAWGGQVRVEVLGPFLLGVCGEAAEVADLSMCLPVKDEERDLEAVLASFRGFVREIVVGVDPRTTDRTREIAAAYADVVFELEDPACQDPSNPLHDPAVPPSGVHFAWLRNQCIERCSSSWVFMTEGHERLYQGGDLLLGLDEVLGECDVAYVWRRGDGQRWLFPWIARRELRYTRSTHNQLDIPDGARRAILRSVVTYHDRHHDNAAARSVQRREQNRKTLWDDWELKGNPSSLFYFAQELREGSPEEAIRRFRQFLAETDGKPGQGQMRYQARLILAKMFRWLAQEDERNGLDAMAAEWLGEARKVLLGATGDDWARTEHWVWLGDLAFNAGQLDEAYQFYGYAGTAVGRFPPAVWWIDEGAYLWLPAQRLAMTCGHLGREHEALVWAERVLALLPDYAREEAYAEAQANVDVIREVIEERERPRVASLTAC